MRRRFFVGCAGWSIPGGCGSRFPGDGTHLERYARVFPLLRRFRVGRVAADPAPAPGAGRPGGCSSRVYCRIHGSPRMHYSAYSGKFLSDPADTLRALPRCNRVWCILDNTAPGAAVGSALTLLERLSG